MRLLRFREDDNAEFDLAKVKEEAPQEHEQKRGWIEEEDGTIRWIGDVKDKEEEPLEDPGAGSG